MVILGFILMSTVAAGGEEKKNEKDEDANTTFDIAPFSNRLAKALCARLAFQIAGVWTHIAELDARLAVEFVERAGAVSRSRLVLDRGRLAIPPRRSVRLGVRGRMFRPDHCDGRDGTGSVEQRMTALNGAQEKAQ